ncbi:50S ribosomal protein L10 [Candidatus Woesearchaeota archaeon]|nr:50S ribosomal protein L10 [Candidatus Woesearchaeota archaeon]
MAHIAAYKKETVARLVKLFKEYPIIGALNLENFPASSLQQMRQKLRGKAVMVMTKRRLMKVAFSEAEKFKAGIDKMFGSLKGMPALLFTKENPFAIYRIISKSKSPAPAKPGQIAPRDIEVKAGPTPFMPGPIIGELGSAGIKTGVENGKVAIKQDAIIVKEGQEISQKAASILARLGIQPMEIGLDLTAAYENGTIYEGKVLEIDEEKVAADLLQAASWARNLAMEIAYISNETIVDLIAMAYRKAKALGIEAAIYDDGIIEELLAKAHRQSAGLNNTSS